MAKHVLGRWKVLATCAVLAGMVAGSVSTTSSANTSARLAKGKQVVHVFGWGVETNPALGALFPPATYVVTEPELAAKAINASASSAVRIQYTFCDNKNTATGSVACAKQAASPTACNGARCDVALDVADQYDNLSVPLLHQEGIPVVSAATASRQAATTPGNFGISTDATGVQRGLGYVMKSLGAHRVGIMNLISPTAQAYNNAISAALKRQGLVVTGQTILSSPAAPATAAINTVMTGRADGLVDAAPGAVGAAVRYAERTYRGVKIAIPDYLVSAGFFGGLPFSVTNGIGVTSPIQPVTATTVPGIKMFLAEGGLSAATPAYRGQDFPTEEWLAVRFIGNVADTINGSVTRASMLHALRTARNVKMYGLVPPWSASELGKNGAAPNTPYDVAVDERLHNLQQFVVNPGVFRSTYTGAVTYVDPGFKKP